PGRETRVRIHARTTRGTVAGPPRRSGTRLVARGNAELGLEGGLGDAPDVLAELLRAGVRQEEDLVLGEDTTSGGLAVVPLDLREVVDAQDSVDVRQSRTALDTVDDLDLEVLVLQEGTNDLRRSLHGGRPTAIVLSLVQLGSVDHEVAELGGIIREQLRQSEGQLGITTKVVIHPVVRLSDGRTAGLKHATAETLRRIANRRGRVVGGVHHELPSHRVALR